MAKLPEFYHARKAEAQFLFAPPLVSLDRHFAEL